MRDGPRVQEVARRRRAKVKVEEERGGEGKLALVRKFCLNLQNVVTQKGRAAHLSRSAVEFVDIHLGTDGGRARRCGRRRRGGRGDRDRRKIRGDGDPMGCAIVALPGSSQQSPPRSASL